MNVKVIKRLCEAHATPGCEDEVRDIIASELGEYEQSIDKLGNLIVRKGEGKKKLMLASHMDEIGLMVKHIDKQGFIRFTTLGGFFDQTLLNQRVIIHTKKGRVYGVIGSKPPHLMKEEERKKVVEYKDMFIDIGAGKKEDVEKAGVRIGDYITFDRDFEELINGFITGKAFDDRLGCYVLIEVLKKATPKVELYGVATVQEEVGLKGARTSAFKIYPDYAIAIDVTTTGDYPGVREEESNVKLGKGPTISIVDAKGRGLISHPKVRELLIETAEELNIPYQLEVGEGGTTDATAIHLTKEGVPSGVVSIPTRYIHSPVEVAKLEDIENTIKLLVGVVEKLE